MNDIKALAKEVFLGREEAEKRIEKAKKNISEKYVEEILKIFQLSNQAEETTVLIWKLSLSNVMMQDNLSVMFSVDRDQNDIFYNTKFLEKPTIGNAEKLIEAIRKLAIPRELLYDLYIYFCQELSMYFDTELKQEKRGEKIIIKLKTPNIKKKEE